MLCQFLAHTLDLKRGNLVDKLVTMDVLSAGERQRIKEQRRSGVRVNSLMMILREKSAAEFESFLTTLAETGQQSVADVVRQALHTVGQTGQNPLHMFNGKTSLPCPRYMGNSPKYRIPECRTISGVVQW